jgi:hypothetical protein
MRGRRQHSLYRSKQDGHQNIVGEDFRFARSKCVTFGPQNSCVYLLAPVQTMFPGTVEQQQAKQYTTLLDHNRDDG